MKRKLLAIPFLVGMALAFLAFALAPAASSAPAGTAEAGKAFWDAQWCQRCHGASGQGGYGPDLAGRGLRFEQFSRAVHQPWGVMPAYTTQQVSDQTVADLVAYFNSLPAVAEPDPQRTTVPAGAPLGQRLLVETAGCGQCHGAEAQGGIGPNLKEPKRTADTITSIARRGGEVMPAFPPAQVSDAELQNIIAFLQAP